VVTLYDELVDYKTIDSEFDSLRIENTPDSNIVELDNHASMTQKVQL
jgi:hypothetical protein